MDNNLDALVCLWRCSGENYFLQAGWRGYDLSALQLLAYAKVTRVEYINPAVTILRLNPRTFEARTIMAAERFKCWLSSMEFQIEL